jgi:tetratricopeptide (TPR) repeat protein
MLRIAFALVIVLQSPERRPEAAQRPTAAEAEGLLAAEARYRSAIALNPSIAGYHHSLAVVLERMGRVSEAFAEHRAAVNLDSVSARNRAGLGSLLLRQGQLDEAILHLEAAANADPSSVPIRLELAQALVSARRATEAGTVLEQARLLAPSDSSVARAIVGLGPATPPGQGYHDYSGFADDSKAGRWMRVGIERFFAVILGIAALALVAPIAGGILVLLAEMPRRILARRAA